MKLLSYKKKKDKQYRIGFLWQDRVFDVQRNYEEYTRALKESVKTSIPADPKEFFSGGFLSIEKAQKAFQWIKKEENVDSSYSQSEVKLGPPHPDPDKIICVGLNYADHIEEMDHEEQKYPVLFSKFSNALIGPEDPIEKNPLTDQLDYEVELVVMIGKEASHIKHTEAYDYVLGYTIGNDVSARDLQKRTPQWLQGKSLDRSTPIGPWLITKDDISDPENLQVRSYVNGELRQNSNTKFFIFDIPYLIEFISHLMTLKPGDLIFTGTPKGVGMGMTPKTFLQSGDVVTLEIEQIGTLENKIVEQM